MRTNGITLRGVSNRTDDRTADGGVGVAPRDWYGVYAEGIGVGCKVDVVQLCNLGDGDTVVVVATLGCSWLLG